MNQHLIDSLQWRYATKKFDSGKKIAEHDIKTLLDAIQLTPSSYGLQPIKVLVVENKALRTEIQPIAWNQAQVVDASHLIIFCHYTHIDDTYVDQHVQLMANTRNQAIEKLDGFGNHVKGALSQMEASHMKHWTAKQTYIALGQLLLACSLLKIDATPMEGFDVQKLNELLKLDPKNLSASLLCPIGYRHEEDAYASLKKVRKQATDLFEFH